ncbi:FecCD family ABC transporter permease [Cellulomonas edaphi]|uniref:Iron chelate uptake ABC transporter family permease subunit n=1 Tax=Cellulomonas edaphi TaxID=3053468 RepID=A0ABT7S293_9CELL|nr:iron chelate uptake ABC transporter family permease subunit [Cellulomons edaphi]MDM7829739.1 iron chelate uptake ABC transporter family permease subunit [Cellulomons edaphi]
MSVDLGRPVAVWRPRPRTSLRVDRRAVAVGLVLLAIVCVLAVVSLAYGTYQLSLGEVVGALTGNGDRRAHTLVVEWRLPRLLFAIGCGIALALAGSIFQSLTRNPLGSPDVIGLDAGSYAGAVIVTLVIGSTAYTDIALGSLVGGLLTAALVYVLAYRRGAQGFRLIIVGIAVAAMLSSFNAYVMMREDPQTAMIVAAWGAGSLASLGYSQLVPFSIALVALLPLAALLARPLAQLELGDDAARSQGVHAERVRLGATILGVAFASLVSAAAGPIAFVALVAPQIAHRLARTAGPSPVVSALTGAALLVSADVVAQHLAVATGLVTVTLGGLYFIWLLIREYRRS